MSKIRMKMIIIILTSVSLLGIFNNYHELKTVKSGYRDTSQIQKQTPLEKVAVSSPLEQPDLLNLASEGVPSVGSSIEPNTLYDFFRDDRISQEEPFFTRNIHVKQLCNTSNLGEYNILNGRMIYSDKVRLIMCEVPKTASVTWQVLLLHLSGRRVHVTDQLLKRWSYQKFPNPRFDYSGMSVTTAWEKAKTYTSFLISRHPFTRLASAYYDKFSNQSTYRMFKREYGRKIAYEESRKYLHNVTEGYRFDSRYGTIRLNIKQLTDSDEFQKLSNTQKAEISSYIYVMRTGEITFPHLIEYIIEQYEQGKVDDLNTHWHLQVTMCDPCAVKYSCILKFENIAEESERLLAILQQTQQPLNFIHFPKNSKTSLSDEKIREMWKLIPEKKVDILRKVYAPDFDFYNYDPYLYRGCK